MSTNSPSFASILRPPEAVAGPCNASRCQSQSRSESSTRPSRLLRIPSAEPEERLSALAARAERRRSTRTRTSRRSLHCSLSARAPAQRRRQPRPPSRCAPARRRRRRVDQPEPPARPLSLVMSEWVGGDDYLDDDDTLDGGVRRARAARLNRAVRRLEGLDALRDRGQSDHAAGRP